MKTFLRVLLILVVLAVAGVVLAFRLGWIALPMGPEPTRTTPPSPSPVVTATVTPVAVMTPSPPLHTRDPRVLRVAVDERPSQVLFLALPQFIRDHRNDLQIECTVVPDAAERWQLLAAGRVDIATGTLDSFVLGASRHDPGAVIFKICNSTGLDSLVARDTADIAALKGKQVAVVVGAGGPLLLGHFLDTARLGPSDVRMVQSASSQEALQMLESGRVQAAVLWLPWSKAATRMKGVKTLATTPPQGLLFSEVCVASRSALEKRQAEVLDFMQYWFELQAQLQANPRLAYEMVAKGAGRDAGEVAEALGAMRLFTLADNKKMADEDVTNEIRTYQNLWSVVNVPNNNGKFDTDGAVRLDLLRNVEVAAPAPIFSASPVPSPSHAASSSPSSSPSSLPSSKASGTPSAVEAPPSPQPSGSPESEESPTPEE